MTAWRWALRLTAIVFLLRFFIQKLPEILTAMRGVSDGFLASIAVMTLGALAALTISYGIWAVHGWRRTSVKCNACGNRVEVG